jgi:hypothetical protein
MWACRFFFGKYFLFVVICQHMLQSAEMRIVTINRGNCYYIEVDKVKCIVLTFV